MAELKLGTSGNDTLQGYAGDTLSGDTGDDTYIVYDPSVIVVDYYNAGQSGFDSVYTFTSLVLSGAASVEFFSTATNAGSEPLDLTGNIGTQVIIGNYGNNVLTGGGGSDTLYGLLGDDTYYIFGNASNGGERIVENAGEGADTIYTFYSYTLEEGSSIEWLRASNPSAVNLTGNTLAQTIVGAAAANVLDGRGGDDTLIGMAGDDIYRVYGAGEKVVEEVRGGNDSVYTSANFYLETGMSIELISAADQGLASSMYLLGNAFDQRIIGDYGNNTLNGGGSVRGDTLIGLYGDDVYRIFGQNDLVQEGAGQGNDTIYTSGNYRLGAGVEVETLSTYSHVSTLAMNLTGNELANVVIGNYGTNILDGGGGRDTLIGLEGSDVFRFTAALTAGVTTIQDYGTGGDVILLDTKVFTGLGEGVLTPSALAYGAAAVDADDRIIYNAATGALSYDADGNGGGLAVQFAQLSTGIAQADLRIVAASIPQDTLITNAFGTYLVGNATGVGTAIADTVTNVTFNPYGVGYLFDLVFGASTTNGAVPSIRFADANMIGTLDFSQVQAGIVTRLEEGYSTTSGRLLLAEVPAATSPVNPYPQTIIGTGFDDVIDRPSIGFGVSNVFGGAGNDYIRGAANADGGAGNDHLFGTVSTRLTGGTGADLFDLPIYTRRSGTNSWSAPNTITDFNPAEDKINLVLNVTQPGFFPIDLKPGALSADQFFEGTVLSAADQRILYNPETGELSFFVRGSAGSSSGEIPLFAMLQPNLHLTAENFNIILP